MTLALATADAVTGLTQLGNRTVIAYKECTTSLAVLRIFLGVIVMIIVDTLVVVSKDGRNINAVGTWHAIFAVGA